jgi:murein L,D-transpeptidase YafK
MSPRRSPPSPRSPMPPSTTNALNWSSYEVRRERHEALVRVSTTLRRTVLCGLTLLLPALLLLAHAQALTPEVHADQIIVIKSQHRMTLLSHGKPIRVYEVALGGGGLAPKERAGDARTPEGHYVLDSKNTNSRFHLAFHISYPNAADRARAKKAGFSPGGDVMIHGVEKKYEALGSLQHDYDWTEGCIALTNPEIEEFAKLVSVGTPIEIKP